MKLIILSLDVSTVSTGWCIFKEDKLFKSGVIKIKNIVDIHERMVILRDKIKEIVVKYKPTEVVIEDVWIGKNPKTAKTLSKFCGIAEEIVYRTTKNKPIIIENTKVKQFFKCKTKDDLFWFLLDILDLEEKGLSFKEDNDYIDSVAQLLCYLHINNKKVIRMDKDYGYLYKFEG